jgi:hypothetical protein
LRTRATLVADIDGRSAGLDVFVHSAGTIVRGSTGGRGKPYRPALLLQPKAIASIVLAAINLPRMAEVTKLTIRSVAKT